MGSTARPEALGGKAIDPIASRWEGDIAAIPPLRTKRAPVGMTDGCGAATIQTLQITVRLPLLHYCHRSSGESHG